MCGSIWWATSCATKEKAPGTTVKVNNHSRRHVHSNKNEILFAKPLDSLIVSSRYGYRSHPNTGKNKFHHGIDYKTVIGTSVYAFKYGRVIYAGEDPEGYGKYVKILHDDDSITLYGHCSELFVSKGEKVSRGETIAASGASGNATGPHLHFGVYKNGASIDPERLKYIQQ